MHRGYGDLYQIFTNTKVAGVGEIFRKYGMFKLLITGVLLFVPFPAELCSVQLEALTLAWPRSVVDTSQTPSLWSSSATPTHEP